MEVTPTTYAIHKKDKSPIFGDDTVHVSLDDHGAGEFIVIHNVLPTELGKEYEGKLVLDFEEFEKIIEVVNMLKITKG